MRRTSLCLLLLTLGCTRQAPVPLDTLVVALGAAPATLDPRHATDANGMRIDALIFSSLVRLGPTLEAVPDAAERFTYIDHVYTFYLRKDLRFHNGRALTTGDVEFSFAQFLVKGSSLGSIAEQIKSIKVETVAQQIVVRIALVYYTEKFLKIDLPAIKLLPHDGDPAKLVGTGPFHFVKQTSGEIELASDLAASRHLIFKIIRDDFTRYQKMRKGEVDIAQMEITPDKVVEFKNHPERFQVFTYPGLSMTYLLVNFRDPWLKQLAVRQALAASINRPEIIRYKLEGMAQPATSLLTPGNFYFRADLRNPNYAPDQARQTIRELGLEGKSLILKTSNAPQAIDNGKVLAYQMSQSGLKVTLQSYEWGTFYNDVKHGNFQIAAMRWVGTVDPDIYRVAFHSSEHLPGRNRGSYFNTTLDKMVDAATREEDRPKRKALYAKVQESVQNDLAVIPLWYDEQVAIAKKNVADYHPNQTGDFRPLLEAHKTYE